MKAVLRRALDYLFGEHQIERPPQYNLPPIRQPVSSSQRPQETSAPTSAQQIPAFDAYRQELVSLEQRAQSEFDRTVMALSGGALGISFAFLDKVLRDRVPQKPKALVFAWILWTLSLTLVLASHYFSALAMRKAIQQVDAGRMGLETPGGFYDWLIKWANALGGIAFVAGVIAMACFVYAKL